MNEATPKCLEELTEKFQYLFEDKLLKEICDKSTRHTFPAQTTLMDIGQEINQMPLILDGSVKVMTEDEQGNELLLYYLEFSDTCTVTLNGCTKAKKSTVRAITETDTTILFIPMEYIDNWMIEYASWRSYVLQSYNSRMNEMISAIDNLVFNSLEDRIKKYLKEKVWVVKSEDLEISHADIARDLHTSRVVVSRIMKKLENEGMIKQGRGKVKYLQL